MYFVVLKNVNKYLSKKENMDDYIIITNMFYQKYVTTSTMNGKHIFMLNILITCLCETQTTKNISLQ